LSNYLTDHFMLQSEAARHLYDSAAKNQPIFDFHCHLSPQEVWENKKFNHMTELWLGGDHYKWRAMRMNGISEHYITGDATPYEKFLAWAQTVPQLMGNPLYHWTHLELKNYFGIDTLLNPSTASEIWEKCNALLQQDEFTPRSLIKRSNVQFIGTTDDPLSNLEYHANLKADESFTTIIAPTFRPDGVLNINANGFQAWIAALQEATSIEIHSIADVIAALKLRVDFFHENGCRASDHDIPNLIYVEATEEQADAIFKKRISGEVLDVNENQIYRSFILTELGKMYGEKQWVMQLHMGAIRNNNTKMLRKLGRDAGFDSVGESNFAEGLSLYLDALDIADRLPRTILYNLNPKDNAVLAGMLGNFYEEGVPGKMQFGSGWWFNDHIDGMEKQMKDLANVGLLSHFVGMLTDSRSLISYPRHEYFRRILCNIIGDWVETGLVPRDYELLENMVANICYNNAEQYFLNR